MIKEFKIGIQVGLRWFGLIKLNYHDAFTMQYKKLKSFYNSI